MSFRYPAHPNTGRTDPFQGEDGKNPFADAEGTAEKASDNPYAAPATAEPVLSPADSYQILFPHRGHTIFRLGLAGFCCACGAALAAVGFLTTAGIASAILMPLCLLLFLVSLSAGGTAWMFGRQDLKAIRAGAMDPTGLKLTQRGRRLGVVGVLISMLALAVLAVAAGLQ